MDYMLSRHPIYKTKIDVAAYEIRSRQIADPGCDPSSFDAERVMFSMFTDASLDQIVGTHSCFITLTPESLSDGFWEGMPSSRVVLGYFNDFSPSDEVGRKLTALVENGCRVALSSRLREESLDVLGNRAYAIKLDVTSYAPDELGSRFKELKQYKSNLLADRVDTYDDLEFCRSLGFDLYQGRFISRSASQKKEMPVNRLAMMRLLSRLQDPNLTMTDLEKTISLDVALSFRLLSYANSASVALPRNVTSIGHAARMIGLEMLRTWTSVLLLSMVDDKPRELMTIALVRARMCERLSESLKNSQKESFFSAGLLSVVDALLDCPMDQAIAELPLVDEVKSALIGGTGPIGQALRCTIAYEHAEWDDVQFYGLPSGHIRDIYMDAISWARETSAGILAPSRGSPEQQPR